MTKREPRRDVFAYTPLLRTLVLIGTVICAGGLVSEYSDPPARRSALVLYGFLGLTIMCGVAIAQVLRGRIELRADEIRVVELMGHRSYPRSLVRSAVWAKGCPVSLELRDGTRANLPDTGHASTKVAGAIRAWLNEGETSE